MFTNLREVAFIYIFGHLVISQNDSLVFLRSGEKDIHAFAESRRGRRKRKQTSLPTCLSGNATPDPGSQP